MMHGGSLLGLGFTCKQHYEVAANTVVREAQMAVTVTLHRSSFKTVARVCYNLCNVTSLPFAAWCIGRLILITQAAEEMTVFVPFPLIDFFVN